MPLMSTCLGRLGSRFSIILDPVRRRVHYGALGLMCQSVAEMVIGVDDGGGTFCTLPLTREGKPFDIVDQRQTMTSVEFEAHSLKLGVSLRVAITAPFWPQDEVTSTVPAYVVSLRVSRLDRVRWTPAEPDARRRGVLRFGLKVPGARISQRVGKLRLAYPVTAGGRQKTGEVQLQFGDSGRHIPAAGEAADMLVPLAGRWRIRKNMLEAAFDVESGREQEFALALVGHCKAPLFERMGQAMRLKYTSRWGSAQAVAVFVKAHWEELLEKSRAFDALWAESSLPAAAQDLAALAFQSYLMCTMWTVRDAAAAAARGSHGAPREWFSVWEGSCWYNSTVDVTFQEAMFYFAFWPQLLELIFAEWSHHANDAAAERKRLGRLGHEHPEDEADFPGAILQHDMGSGWTANGQSYHHAMPVEENSNFLILLYAHGRWWGREKLFRRYHKLCQRLVEYLLWADSTGNGFPDRGTANTIDDATPAVQYGRDNVYLGVKRLAALHAAARIFRHLGDLPLARRCEAEVRKAVRSLNKGWLGDHYPVCLDKSAKGLVDCWTAEPLPYDELPGWDAYSLYTANGLVPLLLVGDLPPGLDVERLRLDAVNAARASMTTYGCGHSSADRRNVWVSMNVWRDIAAAYLGSPMTHHCERYWAQQAFANGIGSEKPNCFTETSLTNNLVWYPRGAAAFGLPLAMARLVLRSGGKWYRVAPVAHGRWPLFPLADWQHGEVPWVVAERRRGRTAVRIDNAPPKLKRRRL